MSESQLKEKPRFLPSEDAKTLGSFDLESYVEVFCRKWRPVWSFGKFVYGSSLCCRIVEIIPTSQITNPQVKVEIYPNFIIDESLKGQQRLLAGATAAIQREPWIVTMNEASTSDL